MGTQYGGSMFSLTDPFYMVMLIRNLGSQYIVWDKSAKIDYLKPGRTHVFAEFQLSAQDLENIRFEVQKNGKINWVRKVEVKDLHNNVICEVEKVLYIRSKQRSS